MFLRSFVLMGCLCIFTIVSGYSQKTTITIKHYGNESSAEYFKVKKNIMKFSPISFISGSYFLDYERMITPNFSVQLGLGVTNRPLSPTRSLGAINLNYDDLFETSNFNDFTYRNFRTGFYSSLSTRLYFHKDNMNGMYAGLKTTHRTFVNDSWNYVVTDAGKTHRDPEQLTRENFKANDIIFNFGYQENFDILSLEIFIGSGIRFIKSQQHQAVRMDNNYINQTKDVDYNNALFDFGLRVGFRF